MELYENIFSRKVQVLKNTEGAILFNYKHLMALFTKINKVYLSANYKYKGSDIECENDTILLKKSDKFLDFRGVRILISKSKEENSEKIEDFFIEEMYRIKFLNQNNETQKIFDFMDIELHDFPDAVNIYKKQKTTKSPRKSADKTKPKQEDKSKDNNKTKNKSKIIKKIKSKAIIEDDDDDENEEEIKGTIAEANEHLPLESDVQEASTSCDGDGSNDKEKFLIISRHLNKYKIIKNDYSIEDITNKGYRIVFTSEKDIFEKIDSLLEKLNCSDNRDVCKVDNNNITIRKPLTEESFINTLTELLE